MAADATSTENIPRPGSSFVINRDMSFIDLGSLSYGKLDGAYGPSGSPLLTLDKTHIKATNVQLEDVRLDAVNASLSSAGALYIKDVTLNNSMLGADVNLNISGPVTVSGGSNILLSQNRDIMFRDIMLMSGTRLGDGATLSVMAGLEVGSTADLYANNLVADYISCYSNMKLENGKFVSRNEHEQKYGPSMIYGSTTLKNMESTIGSIVAMGPVEVEGGQFSARNAMFGNDASFTDTTVDISMLSGASLAVKEGSLNLGKEGNSANTLTGKLSLENVKSEIGKLEVKGETFVSGGSLKADDLTLGAATFNDTTIDISTLSGASLSVKEGSLKLGKDGNSASSLVENLNLKGVASEIGKLEVKGETFVGGGSLKAADLTLGATTFSNVSPKIDQLVLNGPLSLRDDSHLKTDAKAIGQNPVSLANSGLELQGDFSTSNLSMDQSTLAATGDVAINMSAFELNVSGISGKTVSLEDFVSNGQSSIIGGGSVKASNIEVSSGRLLIEAVDDAGTISLGDVLVNSGAAGSFQASEVYANSINASGSLEAHNMSVATDLKFANGDLYLTGESVVNGDLGLAIANASIENLTVHGDARLDASTLTGRKVALDNGASLDNASRLEVQSLVADADIRLLGNSELLAGEMDLGTGHLVLDGSAGKMVAVAVGEFGGGDLTVDANSLLSIGADTPDWVYMGMHGHNASAALGLWTPFRLGAGSYAAIGAGSLAREDANPYANQVSFAADSLLITNAHVASKDGAGAISATEQADANIEAGARLHILGAQKDGLYRVLGENLTVNYDGNAWQGDNVQTDSALVKLERLGGDKLGWFQAKTPGASTVLPGLDPDLGGSVDDANNKGQIPPESETVPRPPSNKPVTPVPPTPSVPDKPDTPDRPDNPNPPQPDTPGQPDNPNPPQPGTPGEPDNPNPPQPGTPSEPDNPNPPQPDTPGEPDNPNPPQPDTPGQPDNPNPPQPDTPGEPDNPNPPQPDTPVEPDNPNPPQPDTPSEPDNPNPPKPDEPDNPQNPEQPGDQEPDIPGMPDENWRPQHVYAPGQLFLSRATNFWFIGHDARLAARTIESAARIFAIGGVPEMTVAANQAGSTAMSQRTGANSGISAVGANGEVLEDAASWHGFAMWISPLYKSVNAYSLTSGYWDVDVNGGLGGVAIGADYTFENAVRLGLSFNIGGGYAQGGGELAQTTNNMSFWGLGAYGGWNGGNFDIAADVAFTSTYNKLEQELPWGMRMDDLKSDITAWALSAGLELGYTFQTQFLDIRPHAGLRYTYLYNDDYDVNSGGAVLEGKARGQNIWTFPVGISLKKEFEFANGGLLRPVLDFSVIPAAGDMKVKSETRFTGTDNWVTLKDQFMDDISYRGSFGLEYEAGSLSLGLNYSIQAGMKTNSQSVMGTFAYTF